MGFRTEKLKGNEGVTGEILCCSSLPRQRFSVEKLPANAGTEVNLNHPQVHRFEAKWGPAAEVAARILQNS